ncbi:MAG: metallophosphoesterase [Thermoleophilia bacterium]
MTLTRIVQLTDLHLFADPGTHLFGIPTRELLLDVVSHVEDNEGQVDHLVVTGDHTHDELPETYAAVRDILHPWHDRLWQVPGNHDDRATLRSAFADRIPGVGAERVTFSFSTDAWLFLGLDTQVPGHVGGQMDAAQIAWIDDQLALHEPEGVVLFLHHPPVLLGSAWLDPIGLQGRELLQERLVEDRRIRLVCCGHVHHESTHQVGSATVVTTPSTGLQFGPDGEKTTLVSAPPGYRVIELENGHVSTRVVRLPEVRYSPIG